MGSTGFNGLHDQSTLQQPRWIISTGRIHIWLRKVTLLKGSARMVHYRVKMIRSKTTTSWSFVWLVAWQSGDWLSGFRVSYRPNQQVSQLLFQLAGPKLGEFRVYGFQDGRYDFLKKLSDAPQSLSLQTFNEDLAKTAETTLTAKHCPTADTGGPFLTVCLRHIQACVSSFWHASMISCESLHCKVFSQTERPTPNECMELWCMYMVCIRYLQL